MSRAEAYLRTVFHFDLSNRLATIHQRHRKTGQNNGLIGRAVLQTVAQKLRKRANGANRRDYATRQQFGVCVPGAKDTP